MDKTNELISVLRQGNYCLMTDEKGVEIYDDHGNLLVCKTESGECLSIPNSDVLRHLYELPLEGKQDIKKEVEKVPDVCVKVEDNNAVILQGKTTHCEDDTDLVWTGQQNPKSRAATTGLIELLASPTYIHLMEDRNTIKLIVWEKIAVELQNQGFKIAKTAREAGMRTFQKWRNMERTYWRYFKNPEENGKDVRKKKPYYFDAMHAFFMKKNKATSSKLQYLNGESLNSLNSDGLSHSPDQPFEGKLDDNKEGVRGPVLSVGEDNNGLILNEQLGYYEDDTGLVWTGQRTQKSRDATAALIELLVSPTYIYLMKDRSTVKLIVWEKIAVELQNQGFRIADTVKEAGMRTFQKWRNMERAYWKYIKHPEEYGEDERKKKPYYFDAMHAFFKQKNKDTSSELQHSLNCFDANALMSVSQIEGMNMDIGLTIEIGDTNGNVASYQPVSSPFKSLEQSPYTEISEETVNALVRLMVTDKYRELVNGKRRKIGSWEKISNDLASLGCVIPGRSIQEKSQNLFKKWRSIKKSCLKYKKSGLTGSCMVKPPYYKMLTNLVLKKSFKDADLSSEVSVHPSDNLKITKHEDHDYERTSISVNMFETLTPSLTPSTQHCKLEMESLTPQNAFHHFEPSHTSTITSSADSGEKDDFFHKTTLNHCSSSKSYEVLHQIKALHESALVVQQQNFSKIISLLEEQVKQQQTLNSLFTQYVTDQSNLNKRRKKPCSKIVGIDVEPVLF